MPKSLVVDINEKYNVNYYDDSVYMRDLCMTINVDQEYFIVGQDKVVVAFLKIP